VENQPSQTVFHPTRSIFSDRVTPHNLIQTCAITLVEDDYTPIKSLSFDMQDKEQVDILKCWMEEATVYLGMNIQFDMMYLRAFDPQFKCLTSGKQLQDLQIFNYLNDETRPEKSLKDLGPVLGIYKYTGPTAKNHKFESNTDVALHYYNVEDTWNTALAMKELLRRTKRDYAGPKLSSECLQFYSDVIWSVIKMSEYGIPMSREYLQDIEKDCKKKIQEALDFCARNDLILEGSGSATSKQNFMDEVCNLIGGDIRDHPLLEYTEKTKQLSYNDNNRNLLASKLQDSHYQKMFEMCKQHSSNRKLLSSYCMPLLYHRMNYENDKSSVIIPETERVYPTWYVTGGKFSDGGTLQGRITCKKPSAQTFPAVIKKAIRADEGVIVGFDLSQIELRVASVLSGDEALLRSYTEGLDLHADRAKQIFGKQKVTKEERQVGKCINFADLFRSGADTMQSTVMAMTGEHKPKSFFKDIVYTRKHHRPGLWEWQENVIASCQREGRYELPFYGQSRFFRGGEKYEVSEMVNFPVQTTASNILLNIQSEISKRLQPEFAIILNVYDALYFHCQEDKVEELRLLWSSVVSLVENELYWNQVCSHYGRKVALEYDFETWSQV